LYHFSAQQIGFGGHKGKKLLCFYGDALSRIILPVACFLSINGSFRRAHAIEASGILGRAVEAQVLVTATPREQEESMEGENRRVAAKFLMSSLHPSLPFYQKLTRVIPPLTN